MTILRPLSILSVVLLTTTGCTDTDEVQVSSDGKKVAIVGRKYVEDNTSDKVKPKYTVMIVDTGAEDAKTLDLPPPIEAAQCLWLNDRLVLFGVEPTPDALEARKKMPKEGAELPPEGSAERTALQKVSERAMERIWRIWEVAGEPLNLRQLDLVIKDIDVFGPTAVFSAFGNPANLAVALKHPESRTVVYDLKTLKEIKTIQAFLSPAGNGWSYRAIDQSPEEQRTGAGSGQAPKVPKPEHLQSLVRNIGSVVFQKNEKAFGIGCDEIAEGCYRSARYPKRAAVDGEGRKGFLQFGTETIFRQPRTEYTFGVFDLASGKLDFGGSSNNLNGQPIIKENCVYLLEAKERTKQGESTSYRTGLFRPGVVLSRHDKDGRKVVAEIPLGKDDCALDYAPSPFNDFFILQVISAEERCTKLFKIPARASLRPEEIKIICPKETHPGQE